MKKNKTLWAGAAFFVYGLVMLYLLFGQRMGQTPADTYWNEIKSHFNYRPMETVQLFLWVLRNSGDPAQISHAAVNLVGNVVMFLPLGFLSPCIWPKLRKFLPHLGYMALIICCIEFVQLFSLLGFCDVDDLILNLIGTAIGFLLWKFSVRIGVKNE